MSKARLWPEVERLMKRAGEQEEAPMTDKATCQTCKAVEPQVKAIRDCPDKFHRCQTCMSDDPKVRAQVNRPVPTFALCDNGAFHDRPAQPIFNVEVDPNQPPDVITLRGPSGDSVDIRVEPAAPPDLGKPAQPRVERARRDAFMQDVWAGGHSTCAGQLDCSLIGHLNTLIAAERADERKMAQREVDALLDNKSPSQALKDIAAWTGYPGERMGRRKEVTDGKV